MLPRVNPLSEIMPPSEGKPCLCLTETPVLFFVVICDLSDALSCVFLACLLSRADRRCFAFVCFARVCLVGNVLWGTRIANLLLLVLITRVKPRLRLEYVYTLLILRHPCFVFWLLSCSDGLWCVGCLVAEPC